MTNEFNKLSEELVANIDEWDTASVGVIVSLMQIERLERIANALESLNQEVGRINANIPELGECIDEYGRFCVTGTMTNYEG